MSKTSASKSNSAKNLSALPAEQRWAPIQSQTDTYADRLHNGRVLCIGGSVAQEVESQLAESQYQAGYLALSSDIEELICRACDYNPDLVYLALDGELQAGLDVLEAFARDSRTCSIPLLALLPSSLNNSVIQEAYSRTSCDFFRLGNTRVELLARTHLLIRLSHGGSQPYATSSPAEARMAANQPAQGRVDLRDEVTDLFSVSYFFHRLPTEVSRARRYKRALSLIAIRCPDAINNEEMSARLSLTLQKHLRDSDIPARLEQDLFVCLLPEATSDKLAALEQRLIRDFERASLTVYVGRAGLDGEGEGCSPQELVERARAGTIPPAPA